MTTKSADYTVKDLAKTESFKPNQSAQRPKTLPQFEGNIIKTNKMQCSPFIPYGILLDRQAHFYSNNLTRLLM